MKQELTVALAGVGGYGGHYVRWLLEDGPAQGLRLAAAMQPEIPGYAEPPALAAHGVPLYRTLDALCAAHSAIDLTILASPINFHKAQTLTALAHGSHVLCEKPLAATVQDARAIIAAAERAGRSVAVGYQWSYSDAILGLKRAILAGDFGAPRRLKAYRVAPRWTPYFTRNNWAGRQRNAAGEWLLDSPVNNAAAHFLHNMFFVLGETLTSSAAPVNVQAELYRAYPIENYDAAALRCHTAGGATLLFYTAHPVAADEPPSFEFVFERATVRLTAATGYRAVATLADGATRDFGDPGGHVGKLWHIADALRAGEPVACDAAAALPHVLCVNGAQESVPEIVDIPRELITEIDGQGVVAGLTDLLEAAYAADCLPSELGAAPWTRPGRVVDLRGYRHFPAAEA